MAARRCSTPSAKATAHLEAKQADDPTERTVVLIITDGEENESTEWTKDRVRERLKAIETKGGTSLFLGADIDAFSEAGSIGVPMAMSMPIGSAIPDSTLKGYAYAASNLVRSRAVRQGGGTVSAAHAAMSFTTDQREDVASGTTFDAGKVYGGTTWTQPSTTTNVKDDGHTVTVTVTPPNKDIE